MQPFSYVALSITSLCGLILQYSKLRGEWEERVKVIGTLEESLAQVRDTFSQREVALVKERDEATQRARTADERLRESENTHSRQLEAQKMSHESHMTQLVQQKDREIEKANQKVSRSFMFVCVGEQCILCAVCEGV